jgi:hypothetical protein
MTRTSLQGTQALQSRACRDTGARRPKKDRHAALTKLNAALTKLNAALTELNAALTKLNARGITKLNARGITCFHCAGTLTLLS